MAAEGAQQKLTGAQGAEMLAGALDRLLWPKDAFGTPMVRISAAAAELVPTVQYGNATIGPVIVEKFVVDNGPEGVKAEIKALQALAETAVAEDRQTLHEQLRAKAAGG